jgi:hypothetical protein
MTNRNSEAVLYDFDPHNLPPEMLRAIGLAVAAAAQTESVVQEFIGALLRIDNIQTRALTAQMSAVLKDHIARSLAELEAPDLVELDEIDELLDRVGRANELRNVIVHNAFMRDPSTGQVFSHRERARGSLQIKLAHLTVEDLERDAGEIYEAGMELMRFMISRGIGPSERNSPLRQAPDRRPKARAERRGKSPPSR